MFDNQRVINSTSHIRLEKPGSTVLRSGWLHDYTYTAQGGEGASAIMAKGDDLHVENVEQLGDAMVLNLQGVKNFHARGLTSTNGFLVDKAVYSGGLERLNERILIEDFDFFLRGPSFAANPEGFNENLAEHGMRFHGWKDLTLRNGRVVYLNYKYRGAALTIKEGTNCLLQDLRLDGPVGFGPLTEMANNADPYWVDARVRALIMEGCEINTPGALRFWAGCTDCLVRNCVVRAVSWPGAGSFGYDLTPRGTPLSLDGLNGNWPQSSGVFVGCSFFGDKLYTRAPNLEWRFYDCTFNGAAIPRRLG